MEARSNKRTTENAPQLKVLLVDDSRSIRQSAKGMLESMGCQITLAEDGFDALCRIAALRPDIIFMDVMMPGLDGFQACALIRASPQFGETPVVLISGSDGLLDRARAELAGARRYILKPFRKADLLEAIAALVPTAGEETPSAVAGEEVGDAAHPVAG